MKKLIQITTFLLIAFVLVPSALAVYGGANGESKTAISVPSTTTTTTTSGGGSSGGGGGGGSGALATPIDFTETPTKSVDMFKGDKATFTVAGESHQVKVNTVGADFVNITISSTPVDYIILVGQTISVDVDEDGTRDVTIGLVEIMGLKATLKFTSLSAETVFAPADEGAEDLAGDTAGETSGAATGGDSPIVSPVQTQTVILIVAIIVAVILAAIWYSRKPSTPTSSSKIRRPKAAARRTNAQAFPYRRERRAPARSRRRRRR